MNQNLVIEVIQSQQRYREYFRYFFFLCNKKVDIVLLLCCIPSRVSRFLFSSCGDYSICINIDAYCIRGRDRPTNKRKKINSRKLSTYYICLWILHMCERMSCMWFAITNLAVCLKNKRLFSCGSATWTWTKHSPCGSTLKYRVDDK